MWRRYYYLTKPGIVYGNDLSAIGGFMLASRGSFDPFLFLFMLGGLSLVMASACVINNYIDRDIDARMKRTSKRALVTGEIRATTAIIYGTALGIVGAGLLLLTNVLALSLAIAGWFLYVVVYGYWKRRSPFGTVVGSLSGAMPPVIGYAAVTGTIDTGAGLLFLILALWQMPHFYAIAIFRAKEYKAASVPVLPVVRGVHLTKVYMLLYALAFVAATTLLTVFGYTGYTYLVAMLVMGVLWIGRGLLGFRAVDDIRWSRRMFGFSLIVLLVFCASISVDAWLP